MTQPRKERRTESTQIAPIVVVLVLLVANGKALVVTVQPACR